MWTRAELKEKAKQVLRGNYWKAFLVSLVIVFVTGSGGGGGRDGSQSGGPSSFRNPFDIDGRLLALIRIAASVAVLIGLAFRIFIGYPLEVGGRRYFLKSAQYDDNSKCFTFAFMGENYGGIIPAMLLRSVFTILWALLLIIPGIIKAYAYRMVPYILAENPNIGAKRALAVSQDMTQGHKWDMFVLDLSFLGWYLLGAIAFGIGVFFVMPYPFATEAELYLALKNPDGPENPDGYQYRNNNYMNNQI
jgi:uncharacterized membrane protein